MNAVARVGYLLAVALGVFLVKSPALLAGLFVVQTVLCLAVGVGPRRVLRHLRKLLAFAALIVASFALTAQDPALDDWIEIPLGPFTLPVNVFGASLGLLMMSRIATIVLASQIARAGDPTAIARGLERLGLPRLASLSLDTVLALLGAEETPGRGGGRGGGGGGGGRHRDAGGGTGESFGTALRRLSRGDVEPILARLDRQIARARDHSAGRADGGDDPALTRDVGVIAGVSLTMLGIRALKILPSVPFAPGHKLVLLTPLYIVASLLTRSRMGSTATGGAMGVASFLMGEGRYGVFEIVKHLVPGVLCDVFVPRMTAGRTPGALVWTLFGGFVAVGRFATIFAMTLLVQAPAVAWAILVPGLAVHVTFGMLSGYVTSHLVRGVQNLHVEYESTGAEVTK